MRIKSFYKEMTAMFNECEYFWTIVEYCFTTHLNHFFSLQIKSKHKSTREVLIRFTTENKKFITFAKYLIKCFIQLPYFTSRSNISFLILFYQNIKNKKCGTM